MKAMPRTILSETYAALGCRKDIVFRSLVNALILLALPLVADAQSDPAVLVRTVATAAPVGPHNGDLITNGNNTIALGFGFYNSQPGPGTTQNFGFGPKVTVMPRILAAVNNNTVTVVSAAGPSAKYVVSTGLSKDRAQGDLSTLTKLTGGYKRTLDDGSFEEYTRLVAGDYFLSSVTDAAGNKTTITYSGNTAIPASINPPNNEPATSFTTTLHTPTRSTLVTRINYPEGRFVTLQYDSKANLVKVIGMDNLPVLELKRDTLGWNLITEMKDSTGTTNFTYTGAGPNLATVSGVLYPDGRSDRIARAANKTTVTSSGGAKTEYTISPHVALEQPYVSQVKANNTQIFSINLNNRGQATEVTGADKRTTYYTYAGNADLPSQVRSGTDATSYLYNASGQPTEVKTSSTVNGVTSVLTTTSYTYDASRRLTRAAIKDTDGVERTSTLFTYEGTSRLPATNTTTSREQAELDETTGAVKSFTDASGMKVTQVVTKTANNSFKVSTSVAGRGVSNSLTRTGGGSSVSQQAVTGIAGLTSTTSTTRTNSSTSSVATQVLKSSSEVVVKETSSTTTLDSTGSTETSTCSSVTENCTTTYTCTSRGDGQCSWSETTTCVDKSQPAQCVPFCSPSSCGTSDGCGGTCDCGSGYSCTSSNGTPKLCGPNGVGGSCGTCPSGQTCNASGQCVTQCTRNCARKNCGSDGCGGSCGTCGSGATCNAAGNCTVPANPPPPPQQQCNCNGRSCGTNSCGTGSCGACGSGQSCANGQCVTTACRYEGQSCGGASGPCCGNGVCSGGVCNPPQDPGWCRPGDPRFGGGNFCNGSAGYVPVVTGTTCTCVKR
jgi:hypothetical protein